MINTPNLAENQPYLENRERGKMRGSKNWYAYVQPRREGLFVQGTPCTPEYLNIY